MYLLMRRMTRERLTYALLSNPTQLENEALTKPKISWFLYSYCFSNK
jgi:hypothetical protein